MQIQRRQKKCLSTAPRTGRRKGRRQKDRRCSCPSGILPSWTSVDLPYEAIEQRRDCRQKDQVARNREIEIGKNEKIERDKKIVQRKQRKAQGAPEKKLGLVPQIAADEQPRANDAGSQTQKIDQGGRYAHGSFLETEGIRKDAQFFVRARSDGSNDRNGLHAIKLFQIGNVIFQLAGSKRLIDCDRAAAQFAHEPIARPAADGFAPQEQQHFKRPNRFDRRGNEGKYVFFLHRSAPDFRKVPLKGGGCPNSRTELHHSPRVSVFSGPTRNHCALRTLSLIRPYRNYLKKRDYFRFRHDITRLA